MHYLDPDVFVELLIKYHDGLATKKEVLFIKQQLKESEQARTLWQDVLLTFGPVTPQSRYSPWVVAAAILLVLIAGDCIYLLFRSHQPSLPLSSARKAVVLQLADGRVMRLGRPVDTTESFPGLERLPVNAISGKDTMALNTLTVPRGLTYAVKLPDSTSVYINSATDIRFPLTFNAQKREVYLEGEAYFMVSPDPARPFIVHTKKADVIALGTSFNVNTYDNGFSATLLTGAIVVTEQNKMVQLSPGQAAVRNQQTGGLSVETFKNDSVPGWMGGRYLFSNATLSEVCKVAARLYDVEIVFDRKHISNYRYTGAINKKQPIQTFVENIGGPGKIAYYFDVQGRLHLQ